MTPRLLRVLPILLALLPPTAVRAQLDTPTSPLPVFQLAQRHDWTLRVTLADGVVAEGRVRAIGNDAIELERGRFTLADVDGVDRRVRHRGGALEGAVVGGLALGTLTLWLLADDSGDDDVDWGLTAAVIGAGAVGALVGGLIGQRVDPSGSGWLPVWPADQ